MDGGFCGRFCGGLFVGGVGVSFRRESARFGSIVCEGGVEGVLEVVRRKFNTWRRG